MKKTVYALAVAVMAAALFTQSAQANVAPGMTFGILDMDKVVRESTAAKGILGAMEAKRKEFEGQINKEEKSLLDAEKAILGEKAKMSEAEFGKKREEFEKKISAAKKMVQDRRQTLDRAYGESMGKLRTEALKIAADIAKEKNYDVVLSDEAVIMAEPAYDITAEVITRLNKNVTKIPVSWTKK